MKFSTIIKATTTLIAACIFSALFAGQTLASVIWQSSVPNTEVPTRIAVDAKGNLYVTEPRGNNRLLIINRQGTIQRTLTRLSTPIGVAVDSNNRIYVGNAGTGSVDVYNNDLTLALSLGSGKGEFMLPSAIAVTSAGTAYVVDKDANMVKVYTADGAKSITIGSGGEGDGKFNSPTGIALDEARNEIYVTDRGIFTDASYGKMGGARVQVFDLTGRFLRSFGQFGSGPGQMKKAEDIATDRAGKLYVTDPNLAAIHVFGIDGNWAESIADSTHVLKTPIGIAVGSDMRMFVASTNNPSIEVYGLVYDTYGYTTFSVAPKTLNFTAVEAGVNPGTQTVTATNSGIGNLAWTAKTSTADGNAWLSSTSSGTADSTGSTVTVSVLSGSLGLKAGSYTGTVLLTAASGAEEIVAVNLAVSAPPAILSVDRTAVGFTAQQGGASPLPQLINITNAGSGAMTWTATPSASWLNLAAGASSVTISPSSFGLAAGTYSGSIAITASGAQRSPVTVTVTLNVVQAGTIRVNSTIANASFDITGPESFSGSGSSWKNEMVKPGDYTVTFKQAAGYLKPAPKKISIETGKESLVSGDYRKKPVATHLIAGSVQGDALVSIIPLAGGAPRTFSPFSGHDASVRIASGDLEGNAVNLVVVSDSKRTIKVFSAQGDQLASYELAEDFNHADVAVGDIDNDGRAEIVVSAANHATRIIKAFSYAANAVTEKAALFTEEKDGKFSVALGDVNGDGLLEVLVADATSARAFAVQGNTLLQLWAKNGSYSEETQIAAGDLNGDGIAEIMVSFEQSTVSKRRGKEKSSLVTVLKGTGEDYGLTIEPFKDLGFTKPATLILGDTDGDGVDELVAGAGPAESNDPVVRTFESDGTYAGTTIKPMNSKSGVNIGLGTF